MFGTPAFLSGFMPQMSTQKRQQGLPYQNLPFWQALQGKPQQAFQTKQLGFIPSAQRLNQMAPSEVEGLLGIAETEHGVNADDLMYQTKKLAPKTGAFTGAPRFLRF